MAVLSLTERAIFALGSISYRTEEFKKFHRHSVISRQAVLSPQRAESSSSLTSNVVLHPYLHLIYWVSTVLFYFEIFLPFFFLSLLRHQLLKCANNLFRSYCTSCSALSVSVSWHDSQHICVYSCDDDDRGIYSLPLAFVYKGFSVCVCGWWEDGLLTDELSCTTVVIWMFTVFHILLLVFFSEGKWTNLSHTLLKWSASTDLMSFTFIVYSLIFCLHIEADLPQCHRPSSKAVVVLHYFGPVTHFCNSLTYIFKLISYLPGTALTTWSYFVKTDLQTLKTYTTKEKL